VPAGGRFTASYPRVDADPAGLAFLDALFEQDEVGVGIWDREKRFTRVNPALAAMNGVPAESHIGHRIGEVLPALGPHLEALLDEVLESHNAAAGLEITGETPAAPGQERHWLASYYPLLDADGEPLGIGAVIIDITERKQAQAALEARERSSEFLLEAGSVLASSLDYKQTLRNVARLAVPFLADWCVVDMVQPDGSMRRVALAHVDRDKEDLAWDLTRRYPSGPNAFEGTPKAARSGYRELVPEIRDSLLERIAQDDEHLRR
jgi:PAS domain S-box-containing protein